MYEAPEAAAGIFSESYAGGHVALFWGMDTCQTEEALEAAMHW
jgi:hypothetical protein